MSHALLVQFMQNTLLEGADLTTMIQTTGGDDSGYKNRKNVSQFFVYFYSLDCDYRM